MKTTILCVEDDAAIRRGVTDALQFAGYTVLQSGDGEQGMELALHCEYDLLLLDLVLPHRSGLQILQQVRAVRPTQSIIVLTARGDESDRVQGLRLGADDYVVKPFSVKELLARVEAVLRRAPQRPSELSEFVLPAGRVDFERREIRRSDGGRVDLSGKECELLQYLARHCGRAIDREELLSHVWGLDPRGVSTRTIDMHVARLREKLQDASATPRVLLTVRGKGYMLAHPAAADGDFPRK